MKKNSKLLFSGFFKAIFFLLVFLMLAGWFLIVYCYFDMYSYRFPKIANWIVFFSHTLVNILLPLILTVLVILVYVKRNKLSALFFVLAIISLPVCFTRSAAETLFSPSICSYTTNIYDFGIFDSSLHRQLKLNPVFSFPEIIPDDVRNPQYCYYYSSASTDYVYVAVSWNYKSSDAFAQQVAKLQLGEESYKINNCEVYLFFDTYFKNAVVLDKSQESITFMISSDKNLLCHESFDTKRSISTLLSQFHS